MRSFADTLPTLRESGALVPPPPVMKENRAFDPLLLTRQAPRPGASKPAAAKPAGNTAEDEPHAGTDTHLPDTAGEAGTSIADIRRALLERQGSEAKSEDAAPFAATGLEPASGPRIANAEAARPAGGLDQGPDQGLDPAAASPEAVKAAPAQTEPAPPKVKSGPKPAASVVPPFVNPAAGSSAKVTVEQQIAQAVAAAKEEAEAEKAAAVEFARKVERDVATRAVADARATWCNEEGEAFAKRCTEGFDALHQRLSEAFARALAPIAEAAIRDAAVRRFAAVLDDLIGPTSTEPAITVTGSPQLIAALRQASGDNGVAFQEAEGETELSVTVGETTLATTIGTWADTLAEALGVTTGGETDG